jgi:hypothetical protein
VYPPAKDYWFEWCSQCQLQCGAFGQRGMSSWAQFVQHLKLAATVCTHGSSVERAWTTKLEAGLRRRQACGSLPVARAARGALVASEPRPRQQRHRATNTAALDCHPTALLSLQSLVLSGSKSALMAPMSAAPMSLT